MEQNSKRKKKYLKDCLKHEFDDNEIVSFYPKTGEVIDSAIVTTPEDLKRKKEFFEQKEKKRLIMRWLRYLKAKCIGQNLWNWA